jgi:hypothetical protein
MRTATCLGLLACVLALTAGETRFDPAGRAKALAPLIEEETFALARIDATRADGGSLLKSLSLLLPSRKEQIEEARRKVEAFQPAFLKAGGTELVVSFSTADVPPIAFVAVPLKDGADAEALAKLLSKHLGPQAAVEKHGSALVAGPRAALERLAKGTPSARPELAAAVTAAGDTAVQVLLLPTNDQRRVIDEVVTLPGGSGKALTRGVRWAALGLDFGRTPGAGLTLQAADAAAARKMSDLIRSGVELLGKTKFLGEEKPLKELLPGEFAKAAGALAPAVTGDVVTVRVSDADALQALGAVVSAIDQYAGGAGRSPDGANLTQILVAMHNYITAHNVFPPHAIYSKDGKPLLSWRVALLPYLGQAELYKQFKLDEPWDSEHNKKLIAKMPKVYRSPRIRDPRPGLTTYLAPVHPECAFTGTSAGLRFPTEFKDGTTNTAAVIDVADEAGVTWTRPADLNVDKKDPWKGLLGHYPSFVVFGMADGSVRRIPKTAPAKALWALFTRAGGEAPPDLRE